MNSFATIEVATRFRKVTYYTVRLEEEEESLFLQFIRAHSREPYREPIALIRSWLRKLGEEIGAQEPYFRHEAFRGGDARALPPPAKYIRVECNLRLYCMRINDQSVVLFGGAEKTADTAQECPNVGPHFLLANRLTKAIDQAIRQKDIQIDEKTGLLIFEPNPQLEL